MTDNSDLDTLLETLILVYQQNLLSGVTKATLDAALEALKELNMKRLNAGINELSSVDLQITEKALKQVEDYYIKLVTDGGSEVPQDGKLVFKPWLNDLKESLGEQLTIISSLNNDSRMTALTALKTQGDERAELAAEYEILRNEREITSSLWHDGGVERYIWRSRDDPTTCPECAGRDGEVFRWDDLPAMPAHDKCRCEWDIYEVKNIES